MQGKLSRRKIAEYVASRVQDGKIPEKVMQEVAAYLLETRRQRELPLVARAIEDTLAAQGMVVASVTSARPLDTSLRQTIEKQVGAKQLYLREIVDPKVLGGVKLQTPDASYDATIAHKLQALRAAKV